MNRRSFLKRGLTSGAISSSNLFLGSGLGLLSNLSNASNSAPSDHKTLVMVYLNGGIDSLGLIIPAGGDSYQRYRNLRQNLAFESNDLIDFGLSDYATPTFCQSMANLFQRGTLSWVSNVGPLRQPTTKAMIEQNENAMPLFVGSHNSQVILWQSSTMDPYAREGWGGRMLELMRLPSTVINPNISLDRSQLYTTTLNMPSFTVNPEGVRNIPKVYDANSYPSQHSLFNDIQNETRVNLLGHEFALRNTRTIESSSELAKILDGINSPLVTYPRVAGYTASNFQNQLKMAARLIESAPLLGQNRQVIMLQMHSFDTHDNQDRDLPNLVSALFGRLEAFQADLESRGIDNRVVSRILDVLRR